MIIYIYIYNTYKIFYFNILSYIKLYDIYINEIKNYII